jgi:hypothetical protein
MHKQCIQRGEALQVLAGLNSHFAVSHGQYKLIVLVGKEVLLKRLFTVVSAALPNQVVQVTAEPKAHAIKGIRKQKGYLLMGAKVVNAQVGRSKNIEVFLACRNDASVDIERVQIRLLEKVRWSAQTYKTFGPKKKENIIWRSDTRVLAENVDVEVPGLKKMKKSILSKDQSEAIYQIYDDLLSGENKISLEAPYESRDTYHGQLIETSHLIEITLFTKALVENPTIEIPVQIGFPPRARLFPPAAPVPAEDRHAAFAVATAIDTQSSTESRLRGISISSPPDAETPVAEAICFVEEEGGTAQSPMVVAPAEAMVLGGSAILLVQDSERLLQDIESSELLAYTESITASPSLTRLLEEMAASVDDYDIITKKLQDPEWSSLLAAITPDEFGTILAHVNVDFDQPDVAKLLGRCVNNGGGNFTCDYCVSAIHNSAECSRPSTVQQLLPLCTNIKICHAQITSELTEWEKVILEQEFEDLLGGTDASLGPNSKEELEEC